MMEQREEEGWWNRERKRKSVKRKWKMGERFKKKKNEREGDSRGETVLAGEALIHLPAEQLTGGGHLQG